MLEVIKESLIDDTLVIEEAFVNREAVPIVLVENVPIKRGNQIVCRIQADTKGSADPAHQHNIRAKLFNKGSSTDTSCSVEFDYKTKEVFIHKDSKKASKELKKEEVNKLLHDAIPFIVFASGELKNHAEESTSQTEHVLDQLADIYSKLDDDTVDKLRDVGYGKRSYDGDIKNTVRRVKRKYVK